VWETQERELTDSQLRERHHGSRILGRGERVLGSE